MPCAWAKDRAIREYEAARLRFESEGIRRVRWPARSADSAPSDVPGPAADPRRSEPPPVGGAFVSSRARLRSSIHRVHLPVGRLAGRGSRVLRGSWRILFRLPATCRVG